jgi:hypothetical protein
MSVLIRLSLAPWPVGNLIGREAGMLSSPDQSFDAAYQRHAIELNEAVEVFGTAEIPSAN